LHFSERRQDFPSDDDKIIYMMSYLRGTALDWFEPQFFDPDPNTVPAWDNNLPVFIQELQDNFGPHDPVGDAEDQLRNLRMKSTDRLTTYMVEFNKLAAYTGWGMPALKYQFYEGLPRRIKDQLVNIEYPNTLAGLRAAASRVDTRYWKREGEKKREQLGIPNNAERTSGSSSNNTGGKKTNKPPKSSTASTSGNSSGNREAPKTPKPYADKLDKSGQLKEAERARRKQFNLCMYCGGAGHKTEECKKRPNASATGKASKVTTEATTSTESKK
jgi:hypothetical protein